MYLQHELLADTIEQNVLDNTGDSILREYGQEIADAVTQYMSDKNTDSITYTKYTAIVKNIIPISEINKMLEAEIRYEFLNGMFDPYDYLIDCGYESEYIANHDLLLFAVKTVKKELSETGDYHGGNGAAKYIIAIIQGPIFDLM